ncbi:MAG: hypothetical protein N4A45_08810 [Flavobacteriales bacterium]|jgi:hypothetical protein|nr:hypothetical protein [Flavobacteriales bacterium]
MNKILTVILLGLLIVSCSDNKIEKKGFQVSEISEDESGKKIVGLKIDTLKLETRPRNVLLTFNPEHRLTPIYKVNYDKKTKEPFTGSNTYHINWNDDYEEGNNWNRNFMPGFEALNGYNLVNVSHYNNITKTENKLFKNPVLIKTLYYPAFSKDTLNYEPVKRDFYMISVYDEDSNKDGFINVKDLRRLYHFDINGRNKKELIPKGYSVLSSEYDSANDFMYIFARKDTNQNGQMESDEPMDIFWIDLKDPENVGKQYKSE